MAAYVTKYQQKASYYVLWCVLVFVIEGKETWKEQKKEGKSGSRAVPFLAAALYAAVCSGGMILGNGRTREILCNIMERKAGYPMGGHTDWLGYRMAAVRCFLSGRNDELDRFFLPYGSNGYLYFENGSSAGGLFFRQGHIWMWLIGICVLAVVFILLSWKWENPLLNRCKNYLAISYFVRLLFSILCIVGMVDSYQIEMPFTRYVMVDGLLLGIILSAFQSLQADGGKVERIAFFQPRVCANVCNVRHKHRRLRKEHGYKNESRGADR